MTQVKEFVAAELTKLERGFVATPETLDNLQAFMQANNGSNDFLLMQMAIQYGVKIALENVAESIALAEKVAEYTDKA
jgi:hypothetical protein